MPLSLPSTMHGVKRSDETKKTAEEREASRLKAVKYGQLASILLAKHAKKEYTLENLELTGKMLRANTDFYPALDMSEVMRSNWVMPLGHLAGSTECTRSVMALRAHFSRQPRVRNVVSDIR